MRHVFSSLVLGVLLAAGGAPAAVLYSNVGGPFAGIQFGAGITQTTQSVATEFVTGGAASILTGAQLHVLNDDFVSAHTYQARLYSDSGGAPSGLLATFSPAALNSNLIPAGNGQLIQFAHTGINLAAGTRYWLALVLLENVDTIGAQTGFMSRLADITDPLTGFSNGSPPGMFISTDSGVSWSDAGAPSNGEFILTGELVPEPGRAILLMVGLAGCLARRRR